MLWKRNKKGGKFLPWNWPKACPTPHPARVVSAQLLLAPAQLADQPSRRPKPCAPLPFSLFSHRQLDPARQRPLSSSSSRIRAERPRTAKIPRTLGFSCPRQNLVPIKTRGFNLRSLFRIYWCGYALALTVLCCESCRVVELHSPPRMELGIASKLPRT